MRAVTAQPDHTKELQTLQLERGLKIIDSPGIVFVDDNFDDRKSKRKSNDLPRNVVKYEDIEDPSRSVCSAHSRLSTLAHCHTVKEILTRTDRAVMLKSSHRRRSS